MNQASRRLRAIFIAVPSLTMVAVLVLPAIGGLRLSFDHNGAASLHYYREMFRDAMFWRALINNLILPIGSLIVEFAVGLGLALVLTARPKRSRLVEVAAILPFAIPEIVILTLARYLLMPRGYVNAALVAAHLHALPWISPSAWLAMVSVIVVDAWHVTPIVMLMLIAGLETIPPELYEAAALDGAGPIAAFRYVTLPMLTPAIIGALVLRGIDALRIFSTVLVLTGAEGVPVLSTYAYGLWSDSQLPREAMAASMILALLVTIIGIGGLAAARKWAPRQTGLA